MLDTRTPPTSSRPRRSSSTARLDARAQARPGRSRAQAAPARQLTSDGTVRRPLPSARSNRLSRSEMRLMGIATACTAVACTLLLLYLAAYAQVTQLGIAQAEARKELRRSEMRRQLLEAERNSLESPQRIEAAAAAAGMVPRGRTPIDYIAAPLKLKVIQDTKEVQPTQEARAQGNSTGGTTEDSRTAAPFGH